MDTVKVKWEVSIDSGYESISIEDLECENIDQWNELSEMEQRERIQEALNDMPERVSIIVDHWD